MTAIIARIRPERTAREAESWLKVRMDLISCTCAKLAFAKANQPQYR
ncbi:hypothetical protein [Nonlabens sp.]|nr:hypothetical protein [Nonlabens sp.]